MTFTKIPKPTEEGEPSECVFCGVHLEAHMTNYAEYENKLQWQLNGKSHYTMKGCKNKERETPETVSTQQTVTTSSNIPEGNIEPIDIDLISPSTIKCVEEHTKYMIGIRNVVQNVCKDTLGDTHPGMIWEMTAIIYDEIFGVAKK